MSCRRPSPKRWEAYSGAGEIARPKAWLFRIAHNAALDALRRRKRRETGRSRIDLGAVVDTAAAADARTAAEASLAAFMPLSATERSSVILVDVLGDSLSETAEVLGVSLAAVKAALHRGRERLRAVAALAAPLAETVSAEEKARLRHYADRFNARDFDALRGLLAEDVKLDLVNRLRRKSTTTPSTATLAAQMPTIHASFRAASLNGSLRGRPCRETPNRPRTCRRGSAAG